MSLPWYFEVKEVHPNESWYIYWLHSKSWLAKEAQAFRRIVSRLLSGHAHPAPYFNRQ